MKEKSEFDKYLSSHTFYATMTEHKIIVLQFSGNNGVLVNAINLLIYTKTMIQHSGLIKRKT